MSSRRAHLLLSRRQSTRRLHWLITWLIAASLLLGIGPLQARSPDQQARGILWQIDRPGFPPSYLFGTIHVDDPRVTRLPAQVEEALQHSRTVVLEMDPGQLAAASVSQRMLFDDGRTLEQVVGPQLYKQTRAACAARGLPDSAIALMKPWATAITLSVPKPQSGVFMDLALYLKAISNQKPVHGLESLDEQLAIFDQLSMPDQIKLLSETLADLDAQPARFEALKKAYLDRDLQALTQLSLAQMPQDEPLYRDLMHRMLDERNARMHQRLQAKLQGGPLFVAVGALHLGGPQGLLRLFAADGWQVRALY